MPQDTTAAAGIRDPGDWIETAAREHPQRVFLRTPAGSAVSYAGLDAQTAQFANALAARGVQPGDRVAVRIEKSVQAVLLYLACLRLGAVFVPLNAAGTVPEFEHVLRDSQPRLAVVSPAERAMLEAPAQEAGVSHIDTLGVAADGSLALLAQRSPQQLPQLRNDRPAQGGHADARQPGAGARVALHGPTWGRSMRRAT